MNYPIICPHCKQETTYEKPQIASYYHYFDPVYAARTTKCCQCKIYFPSSHYQRLIKFYKNLFLFNKLKSN